MSKKRKGKQYFHEVVHVFQRISYSFFVFLVKVFFGNIFISLYIQAFKGILWYWNTRCL